MGCITEGGRRLQRRDRGHAQLQLQEDALPQAVSDFLLLLYTTQRTDICVHLDATGDLTTELMLARPRHMHALQVL